MLEDLVVSATIDGPLGPLVLDGDNAEAYELHPDTKAEMAVDWRKQDTSNEWVEGTFTVSAVRENITETLAVWVNAPNAGVLAQRKQALLARLGQLKYTVALTLDGVTHTWTCSPAQVTVSEKYELMHARTALVTAKVPRLPKAVLTGDFGTLTT